MERLAVSEARRAESNGDRLARCDWLFYLCEPLNPDAGGGVLPS